MTAAPRALPPLLLLPLPLFTVLSCRGADASSAPAPAAEGPSTVAIRPATGRITEEELQALGRPYEMVEGEPLITVLPPDAIPALDLPELVPAGEADAFLAPDEPVLGVVGKDGTAKCYSAWQLDSHEIVNDVLDGEAIAATW